MPFTKEAPTAQARRLADRELHGKATTGEVEWLYAHPLLWYRALRKAEERINNTIFQARTRLAELRTELVIPGEPLPQAYLKAKAQSEARQRGRESFKMKVEARIQDASSLMGGDTVSRWLHGDLIIGFNDIGYAINSGDLTEARALVQLWIKRLSEKEFKRDQ